MEGEEEGADASQRYGYEAEAPWRFNNPTTQSIYEKTYGCRSGEEAMEVLKKELRPLLQGIKATLAQLDLNDTEVLSRAGLVGAEGLFSSP